MEIIYVTKEELEKRKLESIKNLTEDKKRDIIFNDENFYVLGKGHDFLNSFFIEYLTKSGIEALHYYVRGFWRIDGKDYKYIDNKFEEIIHEVIESVPINFDNLQFPFVKNIKPKTLGDMLENEKPKIK